MVVFRTGLRSRSWWTGSGRLQPVPGCDLHLLVFLLTKSVCSKQQDYPLPLPHARAAAHRQVKTFNGRLKLRFAILEAILSDFSKIGNAYSSAFDDASKHGPKTAQKHMKSPPNSVFNRGVPCGTRRGRQRRYCRGTSGRICIFITADTVLFFRHYLMTVWTPPIVVHSLWPLAVHDSSWWASAAVQSRRRCSALACTPTADVVH